MNEAIKQMVNEKIPGDAVPDAKPQVAATTPA